jgi:hypothetical protein
MKAPTLADLPSPPPGKDGWPWTVESDRLPETQPDGTPWPKISIVTPSYNQGQFIEETIRSVLLQGYPNLEYVVIDGGSTDETVAIIQKYEPWIDDWVSEADGGQSHAINKGFSRCSGSYGNWLNSDDTLCRNAFGNTVVQSLLQKRTVCVGRCVFVDEQSQQVKVHRGVVRSLEDLLLKHQAYIPQPATLFPLDLFWEVGGLDIKNHYTMDFDLWGKMLLVGASITYTDARIANFRSYEGQKVSHRVALVKAVVANARQLIDACQEWPQEKKRRFHKELDAYSTAARLGGGRLVQWRLPEPVIRTIRQARAVISRN